jgi:Protein of unknown function (DUF1236)
MRRVLIPTTAGLALLASTGLVSAQGQERGEGHHGPGGAHAPASQGPGGSMREPGAGSRHGNAERGPRVNELQHRPAGNMPERRGMSEREHQPLRSTPQHQPNRAERERATQEQRRHENVERRPNEGLTQHRPGNEGNGRRREVGERREQIEQARTRLSMDDRARLRRSFDFDRARLASPRFDWHIGHRAPRDVHLLPVPRDVIGYFPYYRDYSYFVVGDDICIVDPRTYEIVDVIDPGYWGPPSRVAGLRLSGGQIALVRDSIPGDFPEARLRLRLALGAEIPEGVALYEFPPVVLDRIPELREFRFLVTDEQIVIVEPRDRSILSVIDRA